MFLHNKDLKGNVKKTLQKNIFYSKLPPQIGD